MDMKIVTLKEARRELAHWYREVRRLQDEKCATKGHIKGPGAWEGASYCKTCGSQIANTDFGRKGLK
jgi:hypothetical protein